MERKLIPSVLNATKQGNETCLKEWVETSIWTENMLTALGNGVKGGKWFSLIDKVYSMKSLNLAWNLVKSNKGSAGIDNVTIERFEFNEEKYLQEIHCSLKEQTYNPHSVKRIYIPKSDGKKRPLGIPTIRDRIVQMAVKLVIEPIFEKEFLDNSFGFRPKRNCKDALRRVDGLLKDGHNWVVDADLKSYFDTISHDKLMKHLESKISDQPLLNLIHKFLKQDIVENLKSWSPINGTPQGAVLSPLLANIYLHPLDVMLSRENFQMVRYADDFVILCKTQTEAEIALEKVKIWVKEFDLQLHPDKTHLGNELIKGQGFEFLGYRFEAGNRFVRKKSLKSFRDKVREKTKRNRSGRIEEIIADLNPMLRGWFEYFKHAFYSIYKSNDGFVRRRIRAILLKRNKKNKCFGRTINAHKLYPNAYFVKLKLFTSQKAWEIACQSR